MATKKRSKTMSYSAPIMVETQQPVEEKEWMGIPQQPPLPIDGDRIDAFTVVSKMFKEGPVIGTNPQIPGIFYAGQRVGAEWLHRGEGKSWVEAIADIKPVAKRVP